MRVQDILLQKINEIQSKLPLGINAPDFSRTLNKTIVNNKDNKTNDTVELNIDANRTVPINGSYEADYPLLSQEEIGLIMPRINAAVDNASQKYGVEKNLVRAVIKAESSFQPLALSISGAQGLMQLMPETAKWLDVTDSYNIEQNIMGGTQYIRDQINTFDGDLKLALAAYNAGPNAVKKYDGIPPYEQTQNYVKKVLEYYNMYNQL